MVDNVTNEYEMPSMLGWTAIEQLLKSKPDKFSQLYGYEIVKQKVASFISMAPCHFQKALKHLIENG